MVKDMYKWKEGKEMTSNVKEYKVVEEKLRELTIELEKENQKELANNCIEIRNYILFKKGLADYKFVESIKKQYIEKYIKWMESENHIINTYPNIETYIGRYLYNYPNDYYEQFTNQVSVKHEWFQEGCYWLGRIKEIEYGEENT